MDDKKQAEEKIMKVPAEFIERTIKEYIRTSPLNRLEQLNNYVIWDEPLVGFADGGDPLFAEYKKIISAEHLTPREALARAYEKAPEDIHANISVISWILPTAEGARKSNREQTRLPGRLWSHTRWYGEKCNEKLRRHLVELLKGMGYLATAPFIEPYFKVINGKDGPFSNWSERHAAYAAGLGTFSLSDGLITERGVAIRCGSVVTSLVLPATPKTATGPYSNCLFYAGGKCKACIDRCPSGAITEAGHDKNKCEQYLHEIGYAPMQMQAGYDDEKTVVGCGLCQTKVPCEFRNPLIKLKKNRS